MSRSRGGQQAPAPRTAPGVLSRRSALGAFGFAAAFLAGCASNAPGSSAKDVKGLLSSDGKLLKPADVTLNVASRAVLDFASPLLAEELGVLSDYNINLKVESVSTTEAVPLLARGEIDILIGGLSAGVFNAATAGSKIRVVAPVNYQRKDSKAGIWASSKWLNGRKVDGAVLRGSKHASSQGYQGITMVSYLDLLDKHGVDIGDVEVVTMPQTDQVVALETGAVSTGTPAPAGIAELEKAGSAEFVGPQIPKGWPVVVFLYGPSLLDERPEVGMAFVAAMRHVYTKYLQDDYTSDDKTLAALTKATEQSAEAIKEAPFDYPTELSIPKDYISRMDKTWRRLPDVLQSEDEVTFEQMVDTRFIDYANGL